MLWVAIEDSETHEVSEFEKVTEKKIIYLMNGYMVDKENPIDFSVRSAENEKRVIYEGGVYKGGFGYNLWVASKYVEV